MGLKTPPAIAIGFRGVEVITFTTCYRMVHHGWLTRIAPGAALGGRTPIIANMRLRFARANRFTATAGLRQPLLVPLLIDARESSQMCGSVLHGRFVSQPRLAYVSRSWLCTPRCFVPGYVVEIECRCWRLGAGAGNLGAGAGNGWVMTK